MPSFQPAKGYSRAHSTMAGRKVVAFTSVRPAIRCSERLFEYVYTFWNPSSAARARAIAKRSALGLARAWTSVSMLVELGTRIEVGAVRRDAGRQRFGNLAVGDASDVGRRHVHVALAAAQRGEIGHVPRAVDVGVDRPLRVGLEIGEAGEVHDRVDVAHDLGGALLGHPGQGLRQLRVEQLDLLGDQRAQLLSELLAQRAKHRAALEDADETLFGALVLLAAQNDGDLAHLGQPIENHRQPDFAEKAGCSGDEQVLALAKVSAIERRSRMPVTRCFLVVITSPPRASRGPWPGGGAVGPG